ncbi:MAG: cell division protein SepF [Actinomycetota bacterium]
MSVFHKTMVWLGLVDDEAYDILEDDLYGGEPAARPAPRDERPLPTPEARRPAAPAAAEPGLTVVRSRRTDAPVAPAPAPRPTAAPPPRIAVRQPMAAARVHVMEPRGFNDAQEVGDRLKAGQPVILNLQGVDRDLQRRFIDFASGLAYALSGTMSKAAEQVFLLTPSDVEVSAEEKERLQAEGLYRSDRP